MHECNAMQLLETKGKTKKIKEQRTMVIKEKQCSTRTKKNKTNQGHKITPIT